MANLILKPSTGGVLKLQNDAGTVDALSVSTAGGLTAAGTLAVTGTTTLTGNTTLSGTANNLGTVTAGSIAGATITSATTFPAGHIIQTIAYHNASTATTADTAYSTSNKVVMGAITPQFANSDILIIGHVSLYANANAAYAITDIYKNASDVTETANLTGYSYGVIQMNDAGIWQTSGYSWLDVCSENSTSEKTYGLSIRANSAGGSANLGWGANGSNVMILQEIKR
jgi:hypothetical protein